MSPEHRLMEQPPAFVPPGPVPVALFGKHPGHGDFVSAGMPDGLARLLSDWLGSTLGEVRDLLGPDWEGVTRSPGGLRFWLGAAFGEGQAWRGTMRMSGDKVGRHYPLVLLQPSAPDGLPLIFPSQEFYLAAEEALGDLIDQAVLALPETAAALTARLGQCPGAEQGTLRHEHMFWAMKQSSDVAELCREVGMTDLVCGATARSYWWFANPRAGQSGILGCQGLPDAQALAWLIAGSSGEHAVSEGSEDQ
ncbi:type VI secretion system-associated protein TagF [Paracoccus aminophilus]|uniref:Type VI secretion system protein ImpM n=1 Tax=Paracoccus aminophilus JCM 7686 TaxID=1367847 RepID=S5Z234_PARAH|nr:type VI secretion system-associated protein TagF [Paracoccus aminophilus]AGT11471.1 type VI secretion system protein ImpM [Paracoccus aminophilus JCM 7686]